MPIPAAGGKAFMVISGMIGLVDGSLIQELRFETVSNNLANVGTTAFKKDILSFDEVLTMKTSSSIDFTQGPITQTGNAMDLALEGEGFMKVQTPQGLRYTRDGSLTINKEKTLATQSGDPVLGERGPIAIQGNRLSIESDGSVVVDGQRVDKISVVTFKDTSHLKKAGFSYYLYEGQDGEGPPAEGTRVQQGFLEKSNINITEEMIKMVECFRAFESVQKAIQNIDDMTGKLINEAGMS
jgi:flagellar basal-body rod protein FlgG